MVLFSALRVGLFPATRKGPKRRRSTRAVLVAVLAFGMLSHHRAEAEDYRLSIGDVVLFDFNDDAIPAERLTVSSDGEVSVPLMGGFRVAGLTVPEAHKALRAAFIDRRLLIDPQFSLAVAVYRPIFVLGDVKTPGSFPFLPTLTVEQAVALAGGQSTGGATAEDRLITRARLQGALDENAVELAREAAGAARARAQLESRTTIQEGDLPLRTRGLTSPVALETILPTERQTLETLARAFEARRKQLSAAVEEVTGALSNLQQLSEKQKTVIASARADAQRAKSLYERGLKTLTDVSSVERDATGQEAQLLQIFNQVSTVRRELGELQRQLADLTDTRNRLALADLQKHNAEVERLLVARRSTEEQLLLSHTLAEEQARAASAIVFSYRIRRKVDGSVVTRLASLDDEVAAGDTILVSIDRPPGQRAPASVAAAAPERLR